jgi:hypothetical protein
MVTSGSDAAVDSAGATDADAAGGDADGGNADGGPDADDLGDAGGTEPLGVGLVAPGPQATATSMPTMSAASRTMPA